jgi:hypothetical protein
LRSHQLKLPTAIERYQKEVGPRLITWLMFPVADMLFYRSFESSPFWMAFSPTRSI